MGAACCRLRDDREDNCCLNCLCLHHISQNVFRVCASLFGRGDRALPSSAQGVSYINPRASNDSSIEDMFSSLPRPLPFDSYYRSHSDGVISIRDKGSSPSHEESESIVSKNKWNAKTEFDKHDSKSSIKQLSASKPAPEFAHIYTFSEDEDVCPTCLEEYTVENPKIITSCSHHFHLGCIYDWMERSDNCPVCGKVMAFNETP